MEIKIFAFCDKIYFPFKFNLVKAPINNLNFSSFKENSSSSLMKKLYIHATYAADDHTSDRGIGLLRILVSITLFFSKSVYAAGSTSVASLKTLSLKASSCDMKIMEAIYSGLSESDKEQFNLNFQDEKFIVDSLLIFYDGFSKLGGFEGIELLDLTDLDITNLSPKIFEPMTNLTELYLSGNPNINLNSEVFRKICQQLVVLDVNDCKVDKDAFTIICSNCPRLKVLRASNNPRINFSEQGLIGFKDTLEELKADNCSLDADDMLKVAGFKSLERLDISNNWLKEFFEKLDFGNLKDTLAELKASKVGMTSENFYKIVECSKITVLDISHNNLGKTDAYRAYTDIFWDIVLYFSSTPAIADDDVFLGDLADRLTNLNASRANLSIIQLKEILDSPSIETLDCSFNDFSRLDDTFEIGGAKSALRDVKFSNCYIESPKFLEEILDCQSLAKLDISNNIFYISYKFDFGSSVKSLKWLDVSGPEIINVRLFIEILGKSETIEYLDISRNLSKLLSHCNHTPIRFGISSVVSTIGGLKKSLRTLKASNCNIENDYHLLYSLTDCENLEYLDISGNNLGRLSKNFQFGSSRETLKHLNMNNCGYIRMNALRAVTDLKVLEVLNMDNNWYEETQEHFELGVSKNSLKTISMRSSLSSSNLLILQVIFECRVLETLDLSEGYMHNFEPESFDFGAARSSLRKINMSGCKISSEVLLRAVFDCKKLQELDLNDNNLSNLSEDFKLGDSKHSLKVLHMDRCQIRSQNILFEITDCSDLNELCVANNDFSEIPSSFGFGSSKHSLKVLRMDECGMTNQFTAISSCEVLERLSISHNSFSIYNFGTSRNTLKDLNISGNSFSGIEDFNQIFDCKSWKN